MAGFHPAVAAWFGKRFTTPTEAEARAWPLIRERRPLLLAAPTGSGKTLAAFLAVLDDLVRRGLEGKLEDRTEVVYVSPLKALTNDIRINLTAPLAEIEDELRALGLPPVPIRVMVRSGDTPAKERVAMAKRPPHILVTTPESLYILLTSEGGRRMLGTARVLIVDEIHALLGDKRGAHLALSMERLQSILEAPLLRIGLSATVRPIEEAASFLLGAAGVDPDGRPRCAVVDVGHVRDRDLAIELPRSPLEAVMAAEVWTEVYDRLAELIRAHRTTLVFVNARRMAERVARHLSDRLGEGIVATHHGSLSRDARLSAEQRLKAGELRAIVATASLELGIDIGAVDLVCQLGTTRSIAAFLQRVGRSGHSVGGTPKGRLFPQSRDELVEAAALLDAARRGELDRVAAPRQPLDILAQQIVAEVACRDWSADDLYAACRRAWPYRDLSRPDFDAVVSMLAEGYTARRGRLGAYIHHDRVHGHLRGRRGARLVAITCGGAIPDTADYDVVLEPAGVKVGSVNEDFAVESLAGDIFQLGNTSWRILRVEPGKVRVEDARGTPPNMPFWLGEAPARTAELSAAVSRLRSEIETRLPAANGGDAGGVANGGDAGDAGGGPALAWLRDEVGLPADVARPIVDYLAAARAALGALPTQRTLILERFFDESGGMQLILHAPFGSRVNRAWGLALRKRFCRKFNFELQAATNDNAIVLSLGPTHSFPLEEVFRYLRPETARDVLVQALLAAPMFQVRWRWNASRALAVPRFRRGRRTPAPLLRMLADDLLSLVFPDQAACAENLAGDREVPDHPLVFQTVRDCLEEAMDLDGFLKVLRAIESGSLRLLARDLREPSPLAWEVLTVRPYGYLDDAPLEERRTQAVINRRFIDPKSASDIGALDTAAIERVRREAWPEARDADELHEALVLLGALNEEEIGSGGDGGGWRELLAALVGQGRAAALPPGSGDRPGIARRLFIAAERLPEWRAVLPGAVTEPSIEPPPGLDHPRGRSPGQGWARDEALVEILRGRLEGCGPTTAAALAGALGLPAGDVATALARLEAEGFVLRGRFTPGSGEMEWCARRLLARIHRQTLERLRREIEPVSAAEFLRFLFAWQHVEEGTRLEGPAGTARAVEMLEGFEAAAGAWERSILPARIEAYDPSWLDALCLSGRVAWGRLRSPRDRAPDGGGAAAGPVRPIAGPVRSTPVALLARTRLDRFWRLAGRAGGAGDPELPSEARAVADILASRGALFYPELAAATGLLPVRIEEALGRLVGAGLVTSDGFSGLRALIMPAGKRGPAAAGRRGRAAARFGLEAAGRWSLLRSGAAAGGDRAREAGAPPDGDDAEAFGLLLLKRYGVVFRKILERESLAPRWRDLLSAFRRLEARGDIRGGRFVDGFSGEQFALPEAVTRLREVRRRGPADRLVAVSAADPLNLVGILTPGAKIPPVAARRILYQGGVPIAMREHREVRFLTTLDPAQQWRARQALLGHAAGRRAPAVLSLPA